MPPWLADAALFATPFLLYAAWRRFRPGAADEPASPRAVLLALAGLTLAGAGLAAYGLSRRSAPDTTYVPARVLPDGRIEQGHAEPKR